MYNDSLKYSYLYKKYKNKYINLKKLVGGNIEEKFNSMKKIYSILEKKYSDIILTGSWAVYIYAKKYNENKDNKIKIDLNSIKPQDIDFIYYSTDRKSLLTLNINEILINDKLYKSQQRLVKSKTFTCPGELIETFDISRTNILPNKINSFITIIDGINLYNINKLYDIYKDTFINDDDDKIYRQNIKIEILKQLINYEFNSFENYKDSPKKSPKKFSSDSPNKTPVKFSFESPKKFSFESPASPNKTPVKFGFESPNKSPKKFSFGSPKSPKKFSFGSPKSPKKLRL